MQQLSYVHGTSPTPLIGQTVGRYFDEACARHPEREAVVVRHQNVRLTFAEFRAQVDRLACGLIRLGLKPGERVVINGLMSVKNGAKVASTEEAMK